jgi:hypothetical protein
MKMKYIAFFNSIKRHFNAAIKVFEVPVWSDFFYLSLKYKSLKSRFSSIHENFLADGYITEADDHTDFGTQTSFWSSEDLKFPIDISIDYSCFMRVSIQTKLHIFGQFWNWF